MKICAAQARSHKGDIQDNIENHKKFIELAIFYKANTIIFPELSLTGYEPELAKKLALNINDSRLDVFQKISDDHHIIIGVGSPTMVEQQVCISMIIFHPQKPRTIYSKKHLHPDEEVFFIQGNDISGLLGFKKNMALAICYELSVPDHAEKAYQCGAQIYLASVAKTIHGVEKSTPRLSEIANKYSMTTLMANCVGEFDGCISGGKSAVWNNNGNLIGQLDHENEGLLIFDIESHELTKKYLK